MTKTKKILVFEFHQESNTFNPIPAPFESFQPQCIFEGEARFEERLRSGGVLAGIHAAVTEQGGQLIPAVFLYASSGGRVKDEVFDFVCRRLQHYIETVGEFDAVCADLHGATCAVSHDDACGDLLAFLRTLVGEKPIAVGFDLHANITDRVLQNADIICGYNTYPHVDHFQTGYRAGKLCVERLAGKRFHTAVADIPILIPPAGYTSLEGPFHRVMEQGKAMVESGRILDMTVFPVQPWLDIPDITSRVIAIGEEAEAAKECAQELAESLFAMRDAAQPPLVSVDEILDIAECNQTDQPVILADSADSPNGGCVGDSPFVALRLQARNSSLRTCMFVVDPASVERAFALGVGNSGEFAVGACFTPDMPGPFRAEGRVRSLHDGNFRTQKHYSVSLGKSAVVSFGSLDILLCRRGGASGSPMIYRQFGMEPAHYDLVVVKANTSFRAPYSTISDLIYVADTPGAGASNLKQLRWQHLPAGRYPFDLPEDFELPQAIIR